MFRIRLVSVLLACAFIATPAFAQTGTSASVVIQVRPPGANIMIDGVKWAASDASQPLTVQLAAGSHHIEISAPGMQTFTRDLTLRAGESVPLNVMLSAAEPSPTPRPRVAPPDPGQQPPPPPRPRVPAPQGPPPPQSGGSQNVRLVPNEDGYVFAPDVRITDINGQTSTLIGAYGGVAFGGKLMIGAGAYFQVDGYNSQNMNYFGPVIEYRLFETKTIGLNAHALIGGGIAYGNCCYPVYGPGPHYAYSYNDGFFVFEPEAQLVVRFSPIVRLQVGLGYRVTSGYNLDGVSGSISLQIGR